MNECKYIHNSLYFRSFPLLRSGDGFLGSRIDCSRNHIFLHSFSVPVSAYLRGRTPATPLLLLRNYPSLKSRLAGTPAGRTQESTPTGGATVWKFRTLFLGTSTGSGTNGYGPHRTRQCCWARKSPWQRVIGYEHRRREQLTRCAQGNCGSCCYWQYLEPVASTPSWGDEVAWAGDPFLCWIFFIRLLSTYWK